MTKFFDDLTTNPPDSEQQTVYEDFFKTLKTQAMNEVKTLYPVTCELLRHFWVCLPATSSEAEEKVKIFLLTFFNPLFSW